MRFGEIRKPPAASARLSELPQPYLAEHGEWVDLYWKAWELLEGKIHHGTAANGLAESYLDEGFNELIYQWDSCFMAMFAMYGGGAFPAMATLDNFYRKQRADGWICRVYWEKDGQPAHLPTLDEPMINPPLFAWVEWKYFLLTGDKSRFPEVLNHLDAYYQWIERNCAGKGAAKGLYYTTLLGSGMDNSPREAAARGGWVDLSSQMALFAKYLMWMAREAGQNQLAAEYQQKYENLRRLINSKLWDPASGFYYDLTPKGELVKVKTLAGLWPLVAEVASLPQARRLADHLNNPAEFWRPHVFPTLAADEPLYDRAGYYWRGGVWAPTNYMVIKGLKMYPLRELAAMAAMNHLKNLSLVYRHFVSDTSRIAPAERDGDYRTIWECYSPEHPRPATRWDNRYYSRQDFVGWSGLGPVAMLLEDVIGLQPSAPRGMLEWTLRLTEAHGVRNYRFGNIVADLLCTKNELPAGSAELEIKSNQPFTLTVLTQVGHFNFEVKSGYNHFTVSL
ncbi:MAG: trehalase family glycosidase [Calditrichia bacterium]